MLINKINNFLSIILLKKFKKIITYYMYIKSYLGDFFLSDLIKSI